MSYRQFCERFLTATRTGDKAALTDMLHPEFTVEEAAGLPYGGVYKGVEGWLALARDVVGAWSKFRMAAIEYPGEGADTFTVRVAISGVSRKTGKAFESTVLELWRFKDNKLLQITPYYFDTHLLAEADKA